MLLVIALVVVAFVVSVGAALVISTRRAAALDVRSTIDLLIDRR